MWRNWASGEGRAPDYKGKRIPGHITEQRSGREGPRGALHKSRPKPRK
jgi:hypothetical protein